MLKTKGRFCRSAAVEAEAAESFEECAARAAIPDYRRWHRADDRCVADGDETPFFASVLPYENAIICQDTPGTSTTFKNVHENLHAGAGVPQATRASRCLAPILCDRSGRYDLPDLLTGCVPTHGR